MAQPDPANDLTGRILFEIGPGEKMVEGENCFLLDLDSDRSAMVTSVGTGKNKQYYHYYADGRKEGPFRGQRFGPYRFISNFVVAPDKSNFYASGFTSDNKVHFFD